jgi:hypothetical protein
MPKVILSVRILGVFLALFLSMSALVAVTGELYSNQAPPLAQRMLSALPAASLSILLLLPHRLFLRRSKWRMLGFSYALASLALAGVVGRDISHYLSGGVHWAVIPTGISAFTIVLGNGVALWAQSRNLPPNNSFKSKPLRGSA